MEYCIRPRINALLAQAITKPLVVVRAGMGYGKSLAVSDFTRESGIPTVWVQLSEFDNVGVSFWENLTRCLKPLHKAFAEECEELGFPDTEDKLNQFWILRDRATAHLRHLGIWDDVHLIKNPAVLNVIESIVYNVSKKHTNIMVCREFPKINLSGFLVRGLVANIDEDDMSFTENEIFQYLLQQDLSSELQNLSEIFLDTGGWAFIINFLVRVLKKTPGYTGYVRNYIKQNLSQLMEKEAWNAISERLQRFLVRMSLINRLSAELVSLLAEGDEELLAEFRQQRVVYIRFDDFTGYYQIHNLFLEYLRAKQEMLRPLEIHDTYRIAAKWCAHNGFSVDALTYYEKIGDYESIVPILRTTPVQVLFSFLEYLKEFVDRTPAEILERVEFFASLHVRILIYAGLWQDALVFLKYYEHKFLLLPEADEFKRRTMGSLYFYWGTLRQLLCTEDGMYDCDVYFEKMSKYPMLLHADILRNHCFLGPWINRAGLAAEGAPQEYCEALARSIGHMSTGAGNWMEGLDVLCRGELLFYQGQINAAKLLIDDVLERLAYDRQFALIHLALFYVIRIAAWQGEYEKIEQALTKMEATLEDTEYHNRFSTYDIAFGLYYSILRLPEKTADWLKGKFAPHAAADAINNFGNVIKMRYSYLTHNYAVLLRYIAGMKRQGIILYGRIEILAMEACIHYQMKDKQRAFTVLQEAYETASPNSIIMPFTELGKDMRTLTLAALRDPACSVPQAWLKNINNKSSVYARQQARLIAEYKKNNNTNASISLTPKETEILRALYKGLSRSAIAANQGLSMNTVRLVINTIYEKLQARNLADLIRIVHEQKLMG